MRSASASSYRGQPTQRRWGDDIAPSRRGHSSLRGCFAGPTQKITYITGKWQIMRLLGKYRDKQGANFRLGQFHDDLIKNGSLPLSIVEWILLDDSSALDQALK